MSSSTTNSSANNHSAYIDSCSRKELIRKFQLCGLSIKSDAFTLLETEFLNGYPPYESGDEFVRRVVACVLSEFSNDSALIEFDLAEKIVQQLRKENGSTQRIISHELKIKNVNYDHHGGNKDSQRLHLRHLEQKFVQFLKQLEQRTSSSTSSFEIKKIQSIINTFRSTLPCNVFGFFRRNVSKINEYFLEDDTGQVTLTFTSQTEYKNPLLLENTFVLIEGVFRSLANDLKVDRIGYLPANILYDQLATPEEEENANEIQNVDANMFVFIRDVHLDRREVLEKLKILFTGYNSVSPTPHFFVLVGPFTHESVIDKLVFQDLLRLLLKIISTCDNLVRLSSFIFVPAASEEDNCVVGPIEDKASLLQNQSSSNNIGINFHFTTNPVHLFVNGKHICVFSGDYLGRAKKKVFFQRQLPKEQFHQELAKLIICNSYLLPSLHSQADNSLSLLSLPDLLVFCDQDTRSGMALNFCPFDRLQMLSLASFSKEDFKFKVFYSETRSVEDSQINF